MLKQLDIKNFTVFAEASFEFAAGLNVMVGENGTGKSHILKLIYAVVSVINQKNKVNDFVNLRDNVAGPVTFSFKLGNIFKAKIPLDILRKSSNQKNTSGAFNLFFENQLLNRSFTYSYNKDNNLTFGLTLPKQELDDKKVVFLPTRELLTIYPGFISLYTNRYLEFDETYYDTCLLLGEPLLKNPNKDLLAILEKSMNGKVELEGGRFYLVSNDGIKTEMPLVAEGLRKLAMLAQLIAVGALEKGSYLFWDEPEANLNPRLIKEVARVIVQLANAGIQIFIATHSLFLLRELAILQASQKRPTPQRYFALKHTDNGVEVEQGNAIDELQTLVILDEELQQSDRYMAVE